MSTDSVLPILFNEPMPESGVFTLKKSTAHLLSLVSAIDIDIISHTKIYSRNLFRYLPWYKANKGGGAITLGNKNWQSITFTENFFSADRDLYGRAAYGNNLNTWLRLTAHEVGHLGHALKYKSLPIYLIVFTYQYLLYGHDKAPLEIEADVGRHNYVAFKNYLSNENSPSSLEDLLRSDSDEALKIQILNIWWAAYNQSISRK